MAKQKDEELISDIINFLKKERELYGDFSITASDSAVTYSASAQEDQEQAESAKDTVNEITVDSVDPINENKITESANTNIIEPQENLFEDKDNKDRQFYSKIGECNSLEELRTLCAKADILKTDLDNTNLVFGVGNPDADLMLIGEAPGAEEDKQGEPFVGAAGQLLNKILEAINFDREDVYIANILKHRPPNNRNPKPEERQRSLPFLLRQIDLIEPKLILCLGKVSAQTLLNTEQSLSSMRGTFHTFRGKYELMATYHPAALLRHPKWKRPTWEDVQKLRNRYDELDGTP